MSNLNTEEKDDKNLVDYAKSQMWGCFKNTKRKLLVASAWVKGIREKMHKIDKRVVANEDIDVNTNSEKILRAFNINQPQLEEYILSEYLSDPEIILRYIDKNYEILKEAQEIISSINRSIEKDNSKEAFKHALLFVDLYAEMSAYEYFINGLIQGICEGGDSGDVKHIIARANNWRNDESIDESIKILEKILQFIFDGEKDGNTFAQKAVNYLHVNELVDFLEGKLTKEGIINIIEKRDAHGYILINFREESHQNKVLDIETKNEKIEIEKLMHSIYEFVSSQKLIDEKKIIGKSVSAREDIIQGECVVVCQENDLTSEINIDGKILVTTMTTPKFVPYMGSSKGIITDNGGLICHAAIIAREMNIPCIIGTEVATNILKTGDVVEMDLKSGIIKKVNFSK
ncbi:MAG: phosphoenolpyruvate synthase [uncultured bacterium]|nr:MAG: phosphoenolpyruvate synthase [uncultured bacterium]KKP69023.1 MAG: PpsA [Candidatus Moranbacteria bacterium GW2011_GWE1_35_17]KKP74397.1 MAG: PpsA [Candidatus Moranbacteria bacterium GW2011_GWE2_35_164]KKP84119.1 MAG: PpsA [Candidatus Moranbacteria bacterium GW2011_GWF1_35_5]KKP85306.1 MAG: PpsA [Candidatus Moranbacteria bacterium GW2011_GWF2_35_54]